MRAAALLLGLPLAALSPARAEACGPCGSAVDCAHAADVCRQDLLKKEVACVKARCNSACSSWLADYKSKTCSSFTYEKPCNDCMLSKCGPELADCGYDTTGGISCADWLAGGDGADITPYDPIYAALAVETCVCDGVCGPGGSGDCAAACISDSFGYYLAPALADQACVDCEDAACAGPIAQCFTL